MKTIINKKVCKEILLDNLQGDEIIAYKCKSVASSSKNNYAVLARLHNYSSNKSAYGFIPLGDSNSKPRFVGEKWIDSVHIASEIRDLKVFESFAEMIEAMYKKTF